jgi:hypothetical protein
MVLSTKGDYLHSGDRVATETKEVILRSNILRIKAQNMRNNPSQTCLFWLDLIVGVLDDRFHERLKRIHA